MKKKNEHPLQITINSRPYSLEKGKLPFREVVQLYYGTFDENPNVVYTVSFKRNIHTPSISMVLGDEVEVIEEMMFSVSKTDKS